MIQHGGRRFRQANALTLTGKAGSGFVEDPFGFHMGTVPTQKPRLMMEVGFGVSKPSRRRFHGERCCDDTWDRIIRSDVFSDDEAVRIKCGTSSDNK